MALDTLGRVLKIDCCWIQTISDQQRKKLLLAAERGFSPGMCQEIGAMDLGHRFSQQIIGLGHKIIIPDLSNDGIFGLDSFRKKGYKWLVAVPLMTYRVHGILGTASRNRKLLRKDTPDLIMVAGGLIAASLNKALLSRQSSLMKRQYPIPPPETDVAPDKPEKKPEVQIKRGAPENTSLHGKTRRPDGAFSAHARRMEIFRRSHR
jgi:hypothetical protein